MAKERLQQWLSTEQAGASIGMSSQWVRNQIADGRLRAYVYRTGSRSTYRIHVDDWRRFLAAYQRPTRRR